MATMSEGRFVMHWKQKVAAAALPFEANWTWRALKGADPELHRRLSRQQSAFDRALITKSRKEIAMIGEATALGYHRVVECMQRHAVRVEKISLAKQGPNLQELVKQHGGFDKIPEEAWEWFERAKIVWKAKLVNGEFDTMFDDPSQQEEALR